jgi:hypothetical protein
MAKSDEKNFGPKIVAQMMGACIGSYIEYGVTKKELVGLVKDMYVGIEKSLRDQGTPVGFGTLTDVALNAQVERLKRMVAQEQLPEERSAALWYLLGQVEDLVQKIKDDM